MVGVKILDNQDNFFDDEAREWLEALDDLVKTGSSDKASFILSKGTPLDCSARNSPPPIINTSITHSRGPIH